VENQQVIAPEKTPEEIEHEMLRTRESLTEKVTALESQVVGTVQTAADTLTGTVESVKTLITTAPGAVSDTVKQAAEAVSETVKKTFDISGQVRQHPWTSVGVSALLGCMTGWLVFREGRSREERSAAEAAPAPTPAYTPPPAAPSGPGVFDELFSMLGRKLREVAENVVDTATAAVNKTVREDVPKLVESAREVAAERFLPGDSGTRFASHHG